MIDLIWRKLASVFVAGTGAKKGTTPFKAQVPKPKSIRLPVLCQCRPSASASATYQPFFSTERYLFSPSSSSIRDFCFFFPLPLRSTTTQTYLRLIIEEENPKSQK
ncbi:hypothetical protein NXS19_002031 [Fusarium pseudograminearum]|nr:hypothetical protein NXS19_002031 [Fusarium pseudograminearum]